MKFMYLKIHPTCLFGPTRLIGTWEYTNLFARKSKKLNVKKSESSNLNGLFFISYAGLDGWEQFFILLLADMICKKDITAN